MTAETKRIIDKLISTRSLSCDEYARLINNRDDETYRILQNEALRLRHTIYSNSVYIRGLIEISNYCKNDCFYCGIRKSNKNCNRYRLTHEEILDCCKKGHMLGFRTFVLQGGEDAYYSDDMLCRLISNIKDEFSDCAVTLSLGERSKESYRRLYEAGADRYLLRHETADSEHYAKLHPVNLSLKNRLNCLYSLREAGFQVGCGMMVGSPYQTADCIAKDLKFIEAFQPDMCGIGPFIPHRDTPFAEKSGGSAELTCFLLTVIRIIKPDILLPSTTALGTASADGRSKGLLSSANVVMPNLSPPAVRDKYELYNNKLSSGDEAAEMLEELKKSVKLIGYEIVCDRGDIINSKGE